VESEAAEGEGEDCAGATARSAWCLCWSAWRCWSTRSRCERRCFSARSECWRTSSGKSLCCRMRSRAQVCESTWSTIQRCALSSEPWITESASREAFLRREMVVRLVGLHFLRRRTDRRAISPPASEISTLRTAPVVFEAPPPALAMLVLPVVARADLLVRVRADVDAGVECGLVLLTWRLWVPE
jgi:hypothetical protein